MDKIYNVQAVEANNTHLALTVNGRSYRVRWQDCSVRLTQAAPEQRSRIEVSPSGYGLHWPELDEDLAIGTLLEQAEQVTDETIEIH